MNIRHLQLAAVTVPFSTITRLDGLSQWNAHTRVTIHRAVEIPPPSDVDLVYHYPPQVHTLAIQLSNDGRLQERIAPFSSIQSCFCRGSIQQILTLEGTMQVLLWH